MTEWSRFFPRQTIQHHSNPSLYSNHWCRRSWSWPVLWRLTRPSRTNPPKRCPFHHRRLECKSGMSRDTWRNRQIWPWSTEWSRAKANRVLTREWTGQSANTLFQQHKRRLYIWTSPDGQYQNQNDYILCKDGEALYSQQKQDLELTVAQTMCSLLQNSGLNWRK